MLRKKGVSKSFIVIEIVNNQKNRVMKATVKFYRVSAACSVREINARSKKEAIEIFKKQVKGFISDSDKIIVI